jgi:hypothetical protein
MRRARPANAAAFLPFTAESMTARLAACFDAAAGSAHP